MESPPTNYFKNYYNENKDNVLISRSSKEDDIIDIWSFINKLIKQEWEVLALLNGSNII